MKRKHEKIDTRVKFYGTDEEKNFFMMCLETYLDIPFILAARDCGYDCAVTEHGVIITKGEDE